MTMLVSRKNVKKALAVCVATSLAVLVSACGDDDTSSDSTTADSITEMELTPVEDYEVVGEKPEIVIPNEEPPTDLVIEDLRDGDGEQVTTGSFITVHYVGVSWSNGEQFDASWDREQPFQFTIGVDPVIQGWELGLQGMKVGGQRQLTIPPDLGYGPDGTGPIGPNETLVFVVDLLAVE
jgi:peptidylprolyl isomerase